MDFLVIVLGIACFLVLWKNKQGKKKTEPEDEVKKDDKTEVNIIHKKKEFLATENERKLYFSLQKALNDKYMLHSQVPLISLVEPVEFKHKSKSWAKRIDFVITDTATKIVAAIELDDSTHTQKKRIKRDEYVNSALSGHHPLIRIKTEKFYAPEKIALLLENEAGIENRFSNAVEKT